MYCKAMHVNTFIINLFGDEGLNPSRSTMLFKYNMMFLSEHKRILVCEDRYPCIFLKLIIKIMENNKIVYAPTSKVEKDTITVYGAGKFGEESLILNKERAIVLFIELYNFLEIKL